VKERYWSCNVAIFLIVVFAAILAVPAFAAVNTAPVGMGNGNIQSLIERNTRGVVLSAAEKKQLTDYYRTNPGAIPHPVAPPRTFELDTAGGPDSFGYYYRDNYNDINGPTYNWIDISSTGSSGPANDDQTSMIPIGFSFPFYGTNYTRIALCTNGWLGVSDTTYVTYADPPSLPSSTVYPRGVIAPWWGDLYSLPSPPYWTKYQNLGTDTLVVTWFTGKYQSTGDTCLFQAILVSNGNILFQYNRMTNPSSHPTTMTNPYLTGIENPGGTMGISAAHDVSTWAVSGRAILFYRLGPPTNPVPADNATNVPTNTSMSWTAGMAAASYNVFFGTANPPTTQVITHQNVLTYSTELANNTSYYWKVVSLSDTTGAGNTISSPIWHFTTGSGSAPAAPTNGAISSEPGPTISSLIVVWTDNANNEAGFPITRSTDGNTFSSVTTAPSFEGTGTDSYTDTELAVNTHYWYRVFASSEAATSTNFAAADGWTLADVPSAPTVGVIGITYATISLSPGNNPAGTQFAIYDSTSGNFIQANGSLAATAVWQTATQWGATMALSGLTSGTNYVIKVKARNGAGVETAYSPSLTVVTNGSMTLPFNESFANTTPWPPYDWQNVYPSGDFYYWQRSANANGGTTGAAFYNMYYANVRETAILWTPPISTTGIVSAHVAFDWWFSGYLTGTDTFQVVYSTDGGQTYSVFWERYSGGTGGTAGSDIRTNTSTTNYYQNPSTNTNEWATTEASIPAGALGQSSVVFGFKAVSGASMYTGSSLGLDNIQIFNVTVPRIGFNMSNVSFGYRVTNGSYLRTAYVKNVGADTLRITNVTATTVTPGWTTHTIPAGDSAALDLTWHPTSAGAYVDTVFFTSNANNAALLTTSGTAVDIATLPLSQGFSSNSPWPPDGWQNIYPNGATYYWQYSTNGNGGAGAAYDNLYYTTPNQVTVLWSPPINTVGSSAVRIDFDWWYSGYQAGVDSFQLVYSTDGGTTYTPFWVRYGNGTGGPQGNDIRTNNNTTNYYQIPSSTASEWASTTVMVPDGALNVNGVSFGWRTVKGPTIYTGSSLGLDNILINVAGIVTVGGTVQRADQSGVDSALVTLVNTRRMTTSTYTNVNGHWTASVLADTYNISVNKPCMYPNIIHQGLVLAIGDTNDRLDGDTLYVPEASASPTSLEFIVQPGGTASQTVVMTNSGDWPTDINAAISYPGDGLRIRHLPKQRQSDAMVHAQTRMSVMSLNPTQQSLVDKYMHNAKLSAAEKALAVQYMVGMPQQPSTQPPRIFLSGGPDGDDYRFRDNAEVSGPSFSWVEIASGAGGSGTNTGLTADDQNASLSMGAFSFPFYDQNYSSINVCSNGWLGFGETSTYYTDYTLPYTGFSHSMICPFWDDLYLPSGGSVWYYNDTANNQFIIEWYQVPHIGSTTETYTFEAILRSNGDILLQYNSISTGGTYGNSTDCIGIQASDATTANGRYLVYTFDGNPTSVTANTAILFHHGSFLHYADVSPSAGQILSGQPFELSITATVPDSTPLNTDLSASLIVATNACTTLTVPITIHVLENSVQQASNLPHEYKLHQNYPNPFNPTTEIRFDLKAGGMTKLTVFNSLGQVVTRLVDNYLPAGYHSVQFKGSRLATGIYFYRIESGKFTAMKKMVMVK